MVCLLPAPLWLDTSRPGLQSAVENLADNTIVLSWGAAVTTSQNTEVFYNIYYSPTRGSLFDAPKLITRKTSVAIPKSIIGLGNYIAIRASTNGASTAINSTNMIEVNTDLYSFPSSVVLSTTLGLLDTNVFVDSTAGFPLLDGYIDVGQEIIEYSSLSTVGGLSFVIGDRDPFGCNDITTHIADGYLQVSLSRGFEDKNTRSFKPVEACSFPRPTWSDQTKVGLRSVSDLGIGTAISLSWEDAIAPIGYSIIYYNVYRATSAFHLLGSNPIGITTETNIIDPNLQPGDGYYYAIKSSYQLSNIDFTNFPLIGNNYYEYPEASLINELDGYFSELEVGQVTVSTTSGYPNTGQLKIGAEILTYSGKTATTFNVTERDVFGLNRVVSYPNGTEIRLFEGVEDENFVFWRTTPTWDRGLGIKLPLHPGDGYDGYAYLQNPDGYRDHQIDEITEFHEDDDKESFDSKSYCGFRSENFVKLYQGKQCGTFSGGVDFKSVPGVNGGNPLPVGGGINVWEQSIKREEFLLGLTGEPVVLLRRKWTGVSCSRLSIRHEHPHARCAECFGTTFDGGFDRYINTRSLRPGELNSNGFIQIRTSPYTDDLAIIQDRGLTSEIVDIDAWTISIPTIKDRDVIIRFIQNPQTGVFMEEFRYEVLSVTRNKLLFGLEGKQSFRMKRMNKTEEIYKYPVVLV